MNEMRALFQYDLEKKRNQDIAMEIDKKNRKINKEINNKGQLLPKATSSQKGNGSKPSCPILKCCIPK